MNKLVVSLTLLMIMGLILTLSDSSWAVSLWGQVENSDNSTPADSHITFVSFIEGTDNEIRTEDSTGATYASGFYQDETSNFNGVNTGDQYDIYFTNNNNGEAGSINTNIPSSDTRMDVTLASSSNPAVPTGLSTSVPTQGTVRLTWNDVAGLTYHIYRRISGVTSRYTRIDDPTGQNDGVADPPYDDTNTDSQSTYYYIIVAEDSSTRLSAHTDEAGGDSSLPVTLSNFTASLENQAVTLNWRTESETSNLGFNVYCSESRNGKYVKKNPAIIKGAGTTAIPNDYQFVDSDVEVGKNYFYYLEDISFTGEKNRSPVIRVRIDKSGKLHVVGFERPTKSALLPNYPNPFNPETWIPYKLAERAKVTIRIYNVKGEAVRIINPGTKLAGVYTTKNKATHWDGRTKTGALASSGIYFYQIKAGDLTAVRKMILVK